METVAFFSGLQTDVTFEHFLVGELVNATIFNEADITAFLWIISNERKKDTQFTMPLFHSSDAFYMKPTKRRVLYWYWFFRV